MLHPLRHALARLGRLGARLGHLAVWLGERPLLVAGAVSALLAWPLHAAPTWWMSLAGCAAALVTTVDLASPTRATRALSTVGALTTAALSLAQRPTEPALGLVLLIGLTWTLLHVWRAPAEARHPYRAPPPAPITLTTIGLLTGLTALALADDLPLPHAPVLLTFAVALAAALPARSTLTSAGSAFDALLTSPVRLLVLSFAALAGIGALLLVLPLASTAPGSIRLIDALFTSVSATCVTGLAVLDTPNDFTPFGQAVILALCQLGGLGIMTFAAAAAVYLGRRLGVREEAAAADMIGGAAARRDLESALRTVLRVTLYTELAGAALLTPQFMAHGDSFGPALWRAVFTSISAFCNAGFALQSASLIPYQQSAGVLVTIGLLIVIGGLGPLVVAALPAVRRRTLSLQARLVLWTSLALTVVPMLLFLALEWEHTLAGLSPADKLANAWFQSVTLRTAGFNSIDFAAIQPATWTLCLIAMFIGGSPGSTAGGAKTTTLAVLLLAVAATVQGRSEATAFGRQIRHRAVYEATAIATVGVLSAVAALMALQVTQDIPLDHALFEVVSALGTVGLSMGATAQLDDVGKVLIIACMFAGRVGPLTLFIFLVGRSQRIRRYPFEAVQVG